MRDLGLLPGGTTSQGNAINRLGEVAGEADNSTGIVVAFLYKHGTLIDLGAFPGGEGSLAFGINDLGDVTGTAGAGTDSDGFLTATVSFEISENCRCRERTIPPEERLTMPGKSPENLGIWPAAATMAFSTAKERWLIPGSLPTGKSSSGMAMGTVRSNRRRGRRFCPYPSPITSPRNLCWPRHSVWQREDA